jgi:lysozyme family protein
MGAKYIEALLLLAMIVTVCLGLGHCQIDRGRVQTIQRALGRNGYAVPVTGAMDAKTVAALQDIARQHGWQHKSVPDSRVLIYLGLGPDYSKLLNPNTAMTQKSENK